MGSRGVTIVNQIGKQRTRHRFILNPYAGERFASCPKCLGLTEQSKFPLMIHVHPLNPVVINKTCCYCARCDLIIAHKDDLEEQQALLFERHSPALIGSEYLVMGTLDLDVWERGRRIPLTTQELVANLYIFEEVLLIEPAGRQAPWPRPDGRTPPSPWIVPGKLVKRKPRRNDP
jgi:hypothetical protein